MTEQKKNVVRFDVWVDPVLDKILGRKADIDLHIAAREGADNDAWAKLGAAHVYHTSSAKDELPVQWFTGPGLLTACPKLLCVSTTGAGFDTVDVPACTAAGVLVVNQAGANAQSVSEHTFAMMLGLRKRLNEGDRLLRASRGFSREDLMGQELSGKTLGLVGIGHVGSKVAALGKAFGMTVLATDPYLDAAMIENKGAEKVDLPALLSRADVVSLHCPRDPDTLDLFDKAAFAAMKPGAVFITTARGGIHNEADLIDALQSGHLASAGIDVWDQEPPPLNHPLLAMDNVIASYHTAGVTKEARYIVAEWGARQIIDVLNGKKPARPVNPEVWPSFAKRFEATMGFAVTD
jgi:D-3-phosphoglycerate dehydrogenase